MIDPIASKPSPRQRLALCAHGTLIVALAMMLLEHAFVGGLWGDKVTTRMAIGCYCVLIIGAAASAYPLAYISRWAWIWTAIVLFGYSGVAVPEGVEDVPEITRSLWTPDAQSVGVRIGRLLFTVYLFVPLAAFALLAFWDGRHGWRRWRDRPKSPTTDRRP